MLGIKDKNNYPQLHETYFLIGETDKNRTGKNLYVVSMSDSNEFYGEKNKEREGQEILNR